MRTAFLTLIVVLGTALPVGCDEPVNRGATAKRETPAAESSPVSSAGVDFGSSGSAPGKARDVARRTADAVEAKQQELIRQMEQGQEGDDR